MRLFIFNLWLIIEKMLIRRKRSVLATYQEVFFVQKGVVSPSVHVYAAFNVFYTFGLE